MQIKFDKAMENIAKDPYNQFEWNAVVKFARTQNIRWARPLYLRVLKLMPTCAYYWLTYLNHMVNAIT